MINESHPDINIEPELDEILQLRELTDIGVKEAKRLITINNLIEVTDVCVTSYYTKMILKEILELLKDQR